MKTTKLIIVMGIVLVFCQSFAQGPTKGKTTSAFANHQTSETANQHELYSGGAIYSDFKLEGTAGSAYLIGDWQEGIIIMKDNTVISGNKYRYNIYTQQMQFISNEDTMAVANPGEVKFIQFADKVFVHTDYYCKNELKQGYFELLEDGECSLLKRWVVSYRLVDGEAKQRLSASNDSEEFIRECSCFLKFGDQPAMALKSRKKEFINCFDEDSEQISAYMKRGKLKHKDQDDLLGIVSYYNQLHR
ncbi:MAG: hypothetical protein B6D64_00605 [Bacteroidetes bacterium 4484_276]|nr:MAG: hypothetical protein B6D64_00605 [Bacteroidetes bacterium 4484_276]OYT13771.1 MAG: hypothetical protein B6I19_03360 [Bacteroidetes bacterium 4572_114]